MSDNDTWISTPSAATAEFFDGAKNGKLRLQRCTACNTWGYPPLTICGECGSQEIEWADASGTGIVYSHARLQRVYHPRHQDRLPIILAQVDIPEGLRLMTNLVGDNSDQIRVGDAVQVTFETFPDGGVLPVFEGC